MIQQNIDVCSNCSGQFPRYTLLSCFIFPTNFITIVATLTALYNSSHLLICIYGHVVGSMLLFVRCFVKCSCCSSSSFFFFVLSSLIFFLLCISMCRCVRVCVCVNSLKFSISVLCTQNKTLALARRIVTQQIHKAILAHAYIDSYCSCSLSGALISFLVITNKVK